MEKSSKDMTSSRNLVSTIGALASPKMGDGTRCPEGKLSLLASHTRCKCSMETTHNSVKVKLGIKVMKLVESLIGREVIEERANYCKFLIAIPNLLSHFVSTDMPGANRKSNI